METLMKLMETTSNLRQEYYKLKLVKKMLKCCNWKIPTNEYAILKMKWLTLANKSLQYLSC